MELEDAKGVKKSMELYGNSLLIGLEELTYFTNTILNYSELLNQKKIEKTRNERLDKIADNQQTILEKLKNIEKRLDKLENMWYNKYIDTNENKLFILLLSL